MKKNSIVKVSLSAIILVLLLSDCVSTRKLYENADYDEVIKRLAPRAVAGNISDRKFDMLANAYHNANQSDHERIIMLKKSGQPDIWSEVYQRYVSMKGRNEALSGMNQSDKKAMNYTKLSLDTEASASKAKAERYLSAKANYIMTNANGKDDFAEAKKMIVQLQRINPDNAEIAGLKKKLMLCDAETILLTFENMSRTRVSVDFVNALLKQDAEMPNVTSVEEARTKYDIVVNIRLDGMTMTPERTDAVTFVEEKGGKRAMVVDKTDSKSLTIKGMIEYYGNNGKELRLATPFEVKSEFAHDYVEVTGDMEACGEQTMELVKVGRVPFPTNESLATDAALKLNSLLMEQLKTK